MKYYLQIVRPAMLLLLMGTMFYCGWEWMPLGLLGALCLATALIAAGGFVINDYFDVKIDRINNPDEMVVTRYISRDGAMHLFYALTAAGIAVGLGAAWACQSRAVAGVVVLVPGLLWFYSSSYKRILILGDLVLSAVAALVPLTIALAANTQEAYIAMIPRAIQFFLCTWSMVMTQAVDQVEGDRELEVHTTAVVWGIKTTKILIKILWLFFLAAIVLGVAIC